MKKLDEQVVRQFIEDKGGKLDKEWQYINCGTKINVTCSNGHTWGVVWSSLKHGTWCPECAGGHIVHEENVRKLIENKKGRLDEYWKYVDCKTNFNVVCEEGHRWSTSWNYINSGRWCPVCSLGVDEKRIKKFIEDKDGKLEKYWKYVDAAGTKIKITCEKGHTWEAVWNNLLHGTWCPDCAESRVHEKDIIKFIENKGGKLDKGWKFTHSKNKFNIECEKGHHWSTFWSNLKNGSWCPECSGRITHERDIINFIKGKGGELKKDWKYVNWNTFFEVKCSKGHVFKTTWNRLNRHKAWCKECAGMIVHEEDVRKYIEERNGKIEENFKYVDCNKKFKITCENNHEFVTCWRYLQENKWCSYCSGGKEQQFRETIEKYLKVKFLKIKPVWLKRASGRRLELDGYNEDKKIAFEYQGLQHYECCYINGNSQRNLENIQERDKFKVQRCHGQGILLIVVPYWIPEKQWEKLIEEKYQEFVSEKLAA